MPGPLVVVGLVAEAVQGIDIAGHAPMPDEAELFPVAGLGGAQAGGCRPGHAADNRPGADDGGPAGGGV